MKSAMKYLLAALQGLPLIRLALLLGVGVFGTVASSVAMYWLGYHGKFPDDVSIWEARIQGVVWLGLAAMSIVFLVAITLAWGKADKIRGSFGNVSVEVDFDEDDKGASHGG